MSGLAVFLLLGLTAGGLYFTVLRWTTSLYARGGAVMLALPVQLVRVAALGGLLLLSARSGASPLLVTTLGVVIARSIVLRVAGGAA